MALQQSGVDSKAHIRLQANLRTLQRSDPTITEILDLSTYAVCYQWDDEGNEGWEKQKVEGPLFVVARNTLPAHSLFLLNRLAPRNLQIHLPRGDIRPSKVGEKMLQISKRGSKQKLGIWIDEGSATVDRFIELVTQICGPVHPSTSNTGNATPLGASATPSLGPGPTADDALSKLFTTAGLLPSGSSTPNGSSSVQYTTTTQTQTVESSTTMTIPPSTITPAAPQELDLHQLLGLAPSTSTSAITTGPPTPSLESSKAQPVQAPARRKKKGSSTSTPTNESATPAPAPVDHFPRLAPANVLLRDSGYIPSNAENEARSSKRALKRDVLLPVTADRLVGTGLAMPLNDEDREGRREFVRGLLELIHTDETFVDELQAAYRARC